MSAHEDSADDQSVQSMGSHESAGSASGDILAFEGDIKRVSTLRFHVKWLGCPASENTWERWKNLMDTEQLHKYLISVNLRHLIPRKFHLNYQ